MADLTALLFLLFLSFTSAATPASNSTTIAPHSHSPTSTHTHESHESHNHSVEPTDGLSNEGKIGIALGAVFAILTAVGLVMVVRSRMRPRQEKGRVEEMGERLVGGPEYR